jgi:sterol desaturase/sphingolipid hydroxylase (fatty acid hydroxylase superfamily)
MVFLLNSNIIPILIYVPFSMTPVFKEHSLAVDKVPGPLRLALTVFFCMLCEDFTFYWSHRLLHRKEVYSYVHKMHHKYT